MNRRITLTIVFLLATGLFATGLEAQVTLGPEGPVNPQSNKRLQRQTEHRLTVHPAAEPSPSLRYSLLPDFLGQKPGNGAPYYYRAILMFRQDGPKVRQSIAEWSDKPLAELDLDRVKRTVQGNVLETLRTASRREYCDWQWGVRDLETPSQFFQFLLPELDDARSLGRLLALKARVEIAEHRYDDAIDTLAIGYKLARDVAQPSTLISDLVGISIADTVNRALIELIDAPDSPNMYWALAQLPRPLIDMRRALQHEMMLPLLMFPVLQDPETARRSPEAWRDLIIKMVEEVMKIDGSVSDSGPFSKDQITEAAALGLVTMGYPRAKRELIEAGYSRQQIEQMSVGQVVAIHQSRTYAHTCHEMLKWTYLPFHEAWQRQDQALQRLKQEGYFARVGSSREIIPLANLFLPAINSVRRAETRLSARLDALLAVEAIRMYAAEYEGRLPKSLDEVVSVAVPPNPMTGQPFPYRLDGETAILEIPAGPNLSADNAWRFEITVSRP